MCAFMLYSFSNRSPPRVTVELVRGYLIHLFSLYFNSQLAKVNLNEEIKTYKMCIDVNFLRNCCRGAKMVSKANQ